MPELTRRRSSDAREECWHVYYGDVLAGTIAVRSGIPFDEDPWGWSCGFYPGSHPGEHEDGTAATFEQARADFEAAWQRFLSNRTEADFQEWRDERDWTVSLRSGLKTRSTCRFSALMISMRAIIVGPLCSTTRSSASTAACRCASCCSALGSFSPSPINGPHPTPEEQRQDLAAVAMWQEGR
jgi:hypothetical protein